MNLRGGLVGDFIPALRMHKPMLSQSNISDYFPSSQRNSLTLIHFYFLDFFEDQDLEKNYSHELI